MAQKKCVLGKGGTTYTGREGDTAHTLLMGKQFGWGHRTTLKGQCRLAVATAYLGGATAYLVGGATAYLGGCQGLSGEY